MPRALGQKTNKQTNKNKNKNKTFMQSCAHVTLHKIDFSANRSTCMQRARSLSRCAAPCVVSAARGPRMRPHWRRAVDAHTLSHACHAAAAACMHACMHARIDWLSPRGARVCACGSGHAALAPHGAARACACARRRGAIDRCRAIVGRCSSSWRRMQRTRMCGRRAR